MATFSERRAQRGGGGTGIVSFENRSDDGHAACAALQDARDTLGPDATDRENRLTHCLCDVRHSSQSDGLAEGAFRGCVEDRPKDDEVSSAGGRSPCLLLTVRRYTDEAVVAEQPPRIRGREGIRR